MRLVVDTDVIVAAMRSPQGGSAELLRRINAGHATMLLTVALALEYEAKVSLAEHRAVAGLTLAEAHVFLFRLFAVSEAVYPHHRWRPQLRDPDDEHFWKQRLMGELRRS